MNKKKELLITVIGIVFLLMAMGTATYAMFTFTGEGEKIHSITSGLITFSYAEGTNNLTIASAYPIADSDALGSANYFQFTVEATSDTPIDINYNIYFMPDDNNTLSENYVKMYLTSYDNSTETPVNAPALASAYELFQDNYGYLLYSNTYSFTQPVTSLSTVYRLRMWVDSQYTGVDNQGNILPEATYKVRINVVGSD